MVRRQPPRRFMALLLLTVFFLVGLRNALAEPAAASSKAVSPTAQINDQIRSAWQEQGLRPSPRATEAEWCRRVYLDLVGHVPSVEELDSYMAAKPSSRRSILVERLLGSEYQGDFSANWTTWWTNVLIGRTGGRERRSLINRSAMEKTLGRWILENKPYDQFVVDLLTATGSTNPKAEDFNGATNFLVEKLGENGVQATAKTAQIFLGTAVQCTQCHNHPFNEYRQNQFWELNAFFRQTRVERVRDPGNENRFFGRVLDQDFAGEGRELYRDDRSEIFLVERDGRLVDRDAVQRMAAPIYYELRNGQVRVAYPVFLDGTSLEDKFSQQGAEYGNSGYLEQVHRRRELAPLVVGDRQFDQALVNRIWAHFFGYGFTKPVDDMGPHNRPSHPELLNELGLAFRAAGFDLKTLMRWIVLSEPYALSSRISRGNVKDEPSLGVSPQFSRFYIRQMQAEQLYESLLVATLADATVKNTRRLSLKERWLRQFNTTFGTDDNAEATTFNGSIPQTLTLMNGELVRRACSTGSGSFLDRIANDESLSDREKIDYLYRAALARKPSKEERQVCNSLLASRKGNVVGTLQDIWWAVLNSNEFILIH